MRAVDEHLTGAERDELIAQGRRLDEDGALELALGAISSLPSRRAGNRSSR
jgi:hypothetical protein